MQLFENCLIAEGDLPDPSYMVPRINQILEMLVTNNENVEIQGIEETDKDEKSEDIPEKTSENAQKEDKKE